MMIDSVNTMQRVTDGQTNKRYCYNSMASCIAVLCWRLI